jgi:hypothetical protein
MCGCALPKIASREQLIKEADRFEIVRYDDSRINKIIAYKKNKVVATTQALYKPIAGVNSITGVDGLLFPEVWNGYLNESTRNVLANPLLNILTSQNAAAASLVSILASQVVSTASLSSILTSQNSSLVSLNSILSSQNASLLTQQLILANQSTYTLSDDVLFTNATERATASEVYVKLKEINLGYIGGTIRVYYELKTDNAAYYAYGKIFKNGFDLGVEDYTLSTAFVGVSHDLPFEKNDLLQIYGKRQFAGTNNANIRNQQVRGILPIPQAVPSSTGGY